MGTKTISLFFKTKISLWFYIGAEENGTLPADIVREIEAREWAAKKWPGRMILTATDDPKGLPTRRVDGNLIEGSPALEAGVEDDYDNEFDDDDEEGEILKPR